MLLGHHLRQKSLTARLPLHASERHLRVRSTASKSVHFIPINHLAVAGVALLHWHAI